MKEIIYFFEFLILFVLGYGLLSLYVYIKEYKIRKEVKPKIKAIIEEFKMNDNSFKAEYDRFWGNR